MKTRLSAVALILLSTAAAHRLDEYLQAATISLEKDRVKAQLRLIPGVAVLGFVMASIDTDGDGSISAAEQGAYAGRVLADLSLALDGTRLTPRLLQATFPTMEAFKEGLGEIRLDFAAQLPVSAPERKLVFDNHHRQPIAAYLVNCLVPQDANIRVTDQIRNYNQSHYQLNYVQDGAPPSRWSGGWVLSVSIAGLLLARLAFLARKPLSEPRP